MEIIKSSLTFDIITTLAVHPCFEERYTYANKLRQMKMEKEANELEFQLTREDFYHLLDLYSQSEKHLH